MEEESNSIILLNKYQTYCGLETPPLKGSNFKQLMVAHWGYQVSSCFLHLGCVWIDEFDEWKLLDLMNVF